MDRKSCRALWLMGSRSCALIPKDTTPEKLSRKCSTLRRADFNHVSLNSSRLCVPHIFQIGSSPIEAFTMLWPTLVTHTTCRLEMSVEGLQYTLVGSESVPVLHFWHLPPSLMLPAGHFVHLSRCRLGSVP